MISCYGLVLMRHLINVIPVILCLNMIYVYYAASLKVSLSFCNYIALPNNVQNATKPNYYTEHIMFS